MKKIQEQTLKEIVSELYEELEAKSLMDDRNITETIDKLNQRIEIHEKSKRGLANLWMFLIVVFTSSLIANMLLFDRNDTLESKLNLLEYRDSLFEQFMEPDSNSFITYRTVNGKPVTYHQLEMEKDSLEKKNINIQNLKEHSRIQLGLVTRNYPITFQKRGNIYMIEAPQIDSALHLLPVYRDMVKYDPRNQTWIVSRYNN